MADHEEVRALLERSRTAWENRDVDELIAVGEGAGFGWRARDARLPLRDASPERSDALQAVLNAYEYNRIVDLDADITVEGDTAIIWGFFTEEFKIKGREPEVVRVRFTRIARKRDGAWTYAWGHRDNQSFDGNGRYIPVG
jgi:hypothetical protein